LIEVDSVGTAFTHLADSIHQLSSLGETCALPNNLRLNKTYYWRIASWTEGSQSAFFGPDSFTTGAGVSVSTPTLVSPSNGCTNCEPPLYWNFVTNASRYVVKITNSAGATQDSVVVSDTSFNGLESCNTQYFWTVVALNCSDTSAASSQWNYKGSVCGPQPPPPGGRTAINHAALSHLVNQEALPKEFELKQNYPNPFNPTTTIEYGLPAASHVKLRVFDILGRVVMTLVDERQSAGYKSATFNASNLPSGVYFYDLEASNFRSIKMMILIK
jgi:hypothetical protein